ncbi:MAG: hypothetical protein ACM3MG_07520 [Bacillota bacterium]
MLNKATIFLSLATVLSFTACASTQNQNASLDQRISAEPRADTPEEIAQRAADTFANAPGLTTDQRQKLNKLYLKTYAEAREIRKEIGQMKSLLFREASQKKFKSGDINELTQKIVAADQRRLNIMFRSLEEMQQIVGYGADKKDLYEYLRNYDMPNARMK